MTLDKSCLNQVKLRPAAREDCRRLWLWRNDPETRAASFDTGVIRYEDHERWFERKLASADSLIRIVLDPQERAVGYVRFQLEGSQAQVSVALDPGERGKGYGPLAIQAASDELLAEGRVKRILASVKEINRASHLAFERAGFRLTAQRSKGAERFLELVYPGAAA